VASMACRRIALEACLPLSLTVACVGVRSVMVHSMKTSVCYFIWLFSLNTISSLFNSSRNALSLLYDPYSTFSCM
jgi:hypothetical protein